MKGDFRVGEWLVQPQLNLVSSADESKQLEPRVMELLVCLANHHPDVVSKDRLIQAVWPDSHVGDEVLTSSIYKLRKAFGDESKDPEVIQTVPRRGYRLITSVSEVESESRYQLLESLGRGSMGEVWLADDRLLKRKVALKFVLEEKEQQEKWIQRLEREALAAAALDHPFICKVYETGTLDGRTFIAMEYVEGPTLKARLSMGRLSISEALNTAIEIAEALEIAHANGFVHRDLKPSNIILTEQGHVKITDFGVAKRTPPADQLPPDQATTLTVSMSTVGTIPYMSPEQVAGRPVDSRSDIFALGVLLYEMLSGVNPFQKQLPMETAAAIQEEVQAPLAERATGVSELLEHVVRKTLAKDPARRYQSVQELRTNLEELLHLPEARMGHLARHPKLVVFARLLPWILAPLVGLLAWFWRPTDRTVLRSEITMPKGERFQPNFRQGIALSPDGQYLAFTAGTRERTSTVEPNRLYLRRLDEWSSRPVPDTDRALNPVFSPNSEWLAFGTRAATWQGSREDPPSLKKVSVRGGDTLQLCECSVDFGLSWGSAGGIVFSRGERGPLELIQDNGSDLKTITELNVADLEISHRLPSFLPDGRSILFTAVRSSTPKTRVYVYSLDTGVKKLILEDAWQARYSTTGHLVFTRRGNLLGAPFDLDQLTVTGPEVAVVEGVNHSLLTNHNPRETGASQFSFSNTGLLAYVPGGVMPEEKDPVVSVDRQGAAKPLPVDPRQYTSVRVSPDGESILLWNDYPPARVWLFDIELGKPRLQTFEDIDSWAIFGPGSEHFTFAVRAQGPIEYRKRRLGSGSDVESQSIGLGFTDERWIGGLEWSPDGQRAAVLINTPSTPWDIWILDSSGILTPWHPTPDFREQWPTFSPDGRWLAYGSDQSGRDEVYIRAVSGDEQPIPVSYEGGHSPAWSRDGKELYFRRRTAYNMSTFYAVSIADRSGRLQVGQPVKLFEGRYWTAHPLRNYDVGPDGRFYLIQVPDQNQRQQIFDAIFPRKIHLVHNWFEELKELVPKQ